MSKIFLTVSFLLVLISLSAQEVQETVQDSITIQEEVVKVDMEFNIFHHLYKQDLGQGFINIYQDTLMEQLVLKKIELDKSRLGTRGFRIRIYSNNIQNARNESLEIVEEFQSKFSGIGIYREYDNPYFKVYVGDYRFKDDALKDLKIIKRKYPDAFIIQDFINFPKLETKIVVGTNE